MVSYITSREDVPTRHDGSLSTGHANSCRDMLSRLETMVLMGMDLPLPAIRNQIASGVDLLVHLGRMRDRSRKVMMIAEVDGIKEGEIQMNPIFKFVEDTHNSEKEKVVGSLQKVGELRHREKCNMAGIV